METPLANQQRIKTARSNENTQNNTEEFNLHPLKGTLQTGCLTLTYFVVMQGITNYDAVLIESTSFMDKSQCHFKIIFIKIIREVFVTKFLLEILGIRASTYNSEFQT